MGANNCRVLCEDCKRFFKVEGMSTSDVENALKNADYKPRCKECASKLHTYLCSVCKRIFKNPAIPANNEPQGEHQSPPPESPVCDRCASQMKSYVCSMCKSIFQKPPISPVDTRPANAAQGEDEPQAALEVQQSPKDPTMTLCDSCIKVQLQVMCRTCGEYYLAYAYKKKSGDNGGSATADVKDKGGNCLKCAAQQRELLNKGKMQMLAVTDDGGAKCIVGTANAFDERYMKCIGYYGDKPSTSTADDTNNSEEPPTS